MSLRLAAALAVVLHVAGVPAATAADLYGSYESGASDDDPRYGDIYRHPPPPATAYVDPRYPPYARSDYSNYDDDDRDDEPRYVERREYAPYRREYLRPMPPVERFEERYSYSKYRGAGCVPRDEIRRELVRDGWRDFQDIEPRGDDAAVVTARRPNGQYYRLKIDRCSGQIVRARPVGDNLSPFW